MRKIVDLYDRIVVVSLPARRDRRRALMNELEGIGWGGNPKISFFDAFTRPSAGLFRSVGSHGCFHSHLFLLWQAGVAGESVLILQDDCQFFDEAATVAIPTGTDIFYGGFEALDPSNLQDSGIIGAHCMGFSARAAASASQYLTQLLDPGFQPLPDLIREAGYCQKTRPPIDGALVWFRRSHPELRTHFQLISRQRSSRSDVTPAIYDTIPIVRDCAELGRALLRGKAAARPWKKGSRTAVSSHA